MLDVRPLDEQIGLRNEDSASGVFFIEALLTWGGLIGVFDDGTLKAILAEIGPVDLMKMDIQGAELEVLAAARGPLSAGAIAHAIVGTHGREIHESVRAILEQTKFSIEFDDPAPAMQPDGLIVASFTFSTDARRT